MNTKVCTKCNQELECTSENFYRNKRGKYGFNSICKACERKDDKRYKQENIERVKKNKEKFLNNNPDYKRLYYLKNRGNLRITKQKFTVDSEDKDRKLYRKLYYENNKLKYRNYEKTDKQKQLKNIRYHRYNAKKKQLPKSFTDEQWNICKEYFNNKCCYCGIETKLTKDHFIPLSNNGEFTIDNIVPACQSCNSSKQDSDFFEWYPNQEFYSKKREQKILKYLGYKNNMQQLSIL